MIKAPLLLISGLVFMAPSLFAQGSDIIIRERAKELRNQNNVRQGVRPPTQAPSSPAPSAPPPQSQGLIQFQTDMAAFTTGATVANFTALAAARHAVLEREGWDVERKGLFGAPEEGGAFIPELPCGEASGPPERRPSS